MMTGTNRMVCAGLGALLLAARALAGELPPAGSKPLSSILQAVEGLKIGSITDAEFDDGAWEIKACAGRACHKLDIDPISGAEKRRRATDADDALPPTDGIALSAIAASIEARHEGIISEVDFDDGYWEFEVRKDGQTMKVDVDPKTGAIRQ
jgi:uncharacterized membrane protein YkoI